MLPANALMPELIVAAPLVIVGKHLVSLGAFLELELRRRLVAVGAVRVMLHRQPPISALDLLAARGAGDPQDFVIISLGNGHLNLFYP